MPSLIIIKLCYRIYNIDVLLYVVRVYAPLCARIGSYTPVWVCIPLYGFIWYSSCTLSSPLIVAGLLSPLSHTDVNQYDMRYEYQHQ